MITRVRIENWRAYQSFDLKLGSGTTFLVAQNGVGKSSFIEAVRWALTAEAPPPPSAMRRRADSASVEVELAVSGAAVRIRRSLRQGRGIAPRPSTEAWIDERVVTPELAYRLIADTWGAENRFASRAAFLNDHILAEDEEPELRPHLARLYALDHLQAAVQALEPAIRVATREADAAKRERRASSADLQGAQDALAAAQAAVEAARANSEALRERSAAAARQLADAERANHALDEHQKWTQRRAAVAEEAEPLIGPVTEDADLAALLQAAEAAAERQRLVAAEQQARLRERLATAERLLEQLHQSEGDCPVCRRPLDANSRGYAEEQHQHDRLSATEAMEGIHLESTTTLVRSLRRLDERLRALGDPPTRLPDGPVDLQPHALLAEDEKRAFEASLQEVGRAREALGAVVTMVEEIEARQADDAAVKLYTKLAALEAAKDAFEATVTAVLNSQLRPVAEEVNRRWDGVFPDRPGLRLTPEGELSRSFDDDLDSDLEFPAFSSGEKVVAKVMLRLATLTSTTAIPFCMLDEPLEHLDLDARSYVAQVLAHLSGPDSLNQIVVTTYEQGIALELARIAPQQVRLEFLRTAHVG